MRTNPHPTGAQDEVLQFVRDFRMCLGYPPTRREIANHFGWSSATSAEDHLQALAKKGCLRLVRGISRGIVVL